jgi:hypothetical protein
MNRDFKGIWIPKDIWLNENLTIMEKVFLVEIDSLDNENGCYASNNYFAEFFKVTPQRCSQIINSLIKKEYIKGKYVRKGKEIEKRVLNIFDRGIKDSFKGIKKSLRGYKENVKENNTSNNTNNNIYLKEIEKYYIDSIELVIPGYDSKKDYSYSKNRGIINKLLKQHGFNKLKIMLERYFKNGMGAKCGYSLTSLQQDWIWNSLLQNKKIKQFKTKSDIDQNIMESYSGKENSGNGDSIIQ